MNNFWFYWTMWGLWLGVAFFFEAGKKRTWICASLLVAISTAPYTLPILAFRLDYGYVVLALFGCALLSSEQASRVLHLALGSFIVMMVDVLAQIYWLYDPAILMILPKWTFIILMGILVCSLTHDIWKRMSLVLIGMSQGELLQSLVFYPYDKTIGDTDYLVMVSFLILMTVCWELFTHFVQLLKQATDREWHERIPK